MGKNEKHTDNTFFTNEPANRLGELYSASMGGEISSQPSSSVSEWISSQETGAWNRIKPANTPLSGEDYKKIWMKLNGMI